MDVTATLKRALVVLVSLIPGSVGLFSFLNNVTDWPGTVTRMVYPMLSMSQTSRLPGQVWRAIDSLAVANIAYGVILALEAGIAVIGFFGLWRLIRHLAGPADGFIGAMHLVQSACVYGLFVWGFFFFALGGDWFLAWQTKTIAYVQADALNYCLLLVSVMLALHVMERQITNEAA